jgi:uncharacterized protein
METVLITGGTGLIGTALTSLLQSKGYNVIILSRKPHKSRDNVSYLQWDTRKNYIDPAAIEHTDHIVHLAGAGIADKRWTKKRKQELVDSRVNSSLLIAKALREIPNKVITVVSASAMGWYGSDRKDKKPFTESDPPADNFLGETCRRWEESVSKVKETGQRLVILRTSIVFSNKGGAFKKFLEPLKFGVAPILGSGKQVTSWIHIDDMCRLYVAGIENPGMHGVFNAATVDPVTNKELMLKIARARRRPFIPIHVPAFVLKAIFGELSIEVLKSATVDNSKLKNSGFTFIYPSVDSAINDLVRVP